MADKYISIGKITNFFGIRGEAKVGYSNINHIKSAKIVFMLDSEDKEKLEIQNIRFSKNFAIIKFKNIDDINSLIKFKGQRIFILKDEAINVLDDNEFLIQDLVGCDVFENENKIGSVIDVSTNLSQDLLCIKTLIGQVKLVPFVDEFFPTVDIKNKKIIITPIEGLLS